MYSMHNSVSVFNYSFDLVSCLLLSTTVKSRFIEFPLAVRRFAGLTFVFIVVIRIIIMLWIKICFCGASNWIQSVKKIKFIVEIIFFYFFFVFNIYVCGPITCTKTKLNWLVFMCSRKQKPDYSYCFSNVIVFFFFYSSFLIRFTNHFVQYELWALSTEHRALVSIIRIIFPFYDSPKRIWHCVSPSRRSHVSKLKVWNISKASTYCISCLNSMLNSIH